MDQIMLLDIVMIMWGLGAIHFLFLGIKSLDDK